MKRKITTTNILMGKGVKPGNHTDIRYEWIVTEEALKKIKAKGVSFDLVD